MPAAEAMLRPTEAGHWPQGPVASRRGIVLAAEAQRWPLEWGAGTRVGTGRWDYGSASEVGRRLLRCDYAR